MLNKENYIPTGDISSIGLGTMTFGEQTNLKDAHKIINLCLENGITFIDTAEMYPVYPSSQTYGLSEEIIGKYLNKNNNRDKIFIATKFTTSNPLGIGASKLNWIRGGIKGLTIDKTNLQSALNSSLKRLKIDNIDLYQVHWPERLVSFGNKIEYTEKPRENDSKVLREMLIILNNFIKEGKIKNYGLSNETPWGLMKILSLCEEMNIKKPITLQNQYNLINRSLDLGLKEICLQENILILGYGPLAGGLLTGKYLFNKRPIEARYSIWSGPKNKYFNSKMDEAIYLYDKLAKNNNMELSELAYLYLLKVTHLKSMIVGFRTFEQAQVGITYLKNELSEDIFKEINIIHKNFPNPYLEY